MCVLIPRHCTQNRIIRAMNLSPILVAPTLASLLCMRGGSNSNLLRWAPLRSTLSRRLHKHAQMEKGQCKDDSITDCSGASKLWKPKACHGLRVEWRKGMLQYALSLGNNGMAVLHTANGSRQPCEDAIQWKLPSNELLEDNGQRTLMAPDSQPLSERGCTELRQRYSCQPIFRTQLGLCKGPNYQAVRKKEFSRKLT